MSEESSREALLLHAITRAMALRDLVAVMLSIQARSVPDAEALFREISVGLDRRLDEMKTNLQQMPLVEQVRGEFDWVLGMARKLSVGKAEPPSDQ